MGVKKRNLTLYIVASGVIFFASVLIFVGNYFSLTVNILSDPSSAHGAHAAYDSWSRWLVAVMCVSGVIFYSLIINIFRKGKDKSDKKNA